MNPAPRSGLRVPRSIGELDLDTIFLLFVFGVVIFLPATVFFMFSVSSPTVGVSLACLLVMLMAVLNLINLPRDVRILDYLAFVGAICLAIVCHLLVVPFFHQVELDRATQSLIFLAMMLATAFLLASMLLEREEAIDAAAAVMRLLFVVIAIFGYLRIQPEHAGIAISVEKSVFPFAEPSHFALAFIPFLIHACVRTRSWRRYAWLAVSFAIAYLLQNMTLVVGTFLAAVLSVPLTRAVLLGGALLALIPVLEIEYFTDRLDFALNSNSISSLVYRQGWELVIDAMQRTHGWGIGFQQLGFAPFTSPAADTLFILLRDDSNLRDGGFLAAKLLSELGIFGLAFFAAYMVVAARMGMRLRRVAVGGDSLPPAATLFAWAMIFGVIPEFLVRGLGYFSESVLFCLSGMMLLVLRSSLGSWRRVDVDIVSPAEPA